MFLKKGFLLLIFTCLMTGFNSSAQQSKETFTHQVFFLAQQSAN